MQILLINSTLSHVFFCSNYYLVSSGVDLKYFLYFGKYIRNVFFSVNNKLKKRIPINIDKGKIRKNAIQQVHTESNSPQ